jgi:hypothetical protein
LNPAPSKYDRVKNAARGIHTRPPLPERPTLTASGIWWRLDLGKGSQRRLVLPLEVIDRTAAYRHTDAAPTGLLQSA